MSDRKITEERRDYYDDIEPRIITPPRTGRTGHIGRVSRYSRWTRDIHRPSLLSTLFALAVIGVLVAGFYFYYYSNRSIDKDLTTLRDTSKDAGTTALVKTSLTFDKRLSDDSINVDTENGIVTLNGQVNAVEDRQTAEELASHIEGVKRVVNNLSVSPAAKAEERVKTLEEQTTNLEAENRDLAIKTKVLEVIHTSPQLKDQELKVEVKDQVATIDGLVDTPEQKNVAIGLVQTINGVRAVKTDHLGVRYQQATEPPQK